MTVIGPSPDKGIVCSPVNRLKFSMVMEVKTTIIIPPSVLSTFVQYSTKYDVGEQYGILVSLGQVTAGVK
jgi:hypothetical protein